MDKFFFTKNGTYESTSIMTNLMNDIFFSILAQLSYPLMHSCNIIIKKNNVMQQSIIKGYNYFLLCT